VIYWLATRFDKKVDISDNIEDEKARVEFIRAACSFFYNNLKLKLNSKKLYAADGHAVQELLKVVQVLYNAKKSVSFQNDYEVGQELDITSKKNDLNTIKELSQEIVDLGLNVIIK
jgi:clusterin-associated protein 1